MRYVDIIVTGPEFHDVCSLTVQNIHDHNYHQVIDERVALVFPEYREGQTTSTKSDEYGEEQRLIQLRKGFFGHRIRLFGQSHSLESVFAQDGFRFISDNGNITITETKQIPPTAASFSAFVRIDGMTKWNPAKLRRHRRRVDSCLAEGKTPKHSKSQLEIFAAASQRQARENTKYPYIIVDSISTQSRRSIFIEQRVGLEMGDYNPDTYGFASNKAPFFLPVF